jgi:ABC-2 type transport system permease protein
MGLTAMAILPSLLALGILALISQFGAAGEALEFVSPFQYSTLFPFISVLVFLFCASQAPELFGRDQRAGVLPLYFSRAISPSDYATARTLGLLASLLILVLSPQLLLMVGRVLVAANLSDGLSEELPSLPAALGISLIVAITVGTISAAIAALTPRRAYATVAIIAIFALPAIAAEILVELDAGLLAQAAVLLSPSYVLDGVNAFLFDVPTDNPAVDAADIAGWVFVAAAVAWIVASVAILLRRYRTLQT